MSELINIDLDLDLAVNEAVELFNSGGIFIYPTDTIYGFGCNPLYRNAVRRISEIKRRSVEKQYIMLIGDLETLQEYIESIDDRITSFLFKIWPNPVSVIFKLNEKSKVLLESDSAAFRIPDNAFCIKLLKKIKLPLVSTSVNISDSHPIKEHSDIINIFGTKVDAIFYSEKLESSEESAVVDFRDKYPKVLRDGKINIIELWEKFI